MYIPGTLRSYQSEVVRAIELAAGYRRGQTFTVMFPRQSGKNEVSASLVAATLIQNADLGGSVIVCAPTLHPQAMLSFGRTVALLRHHAPLVGRRAEVDGTTIRVGLASATFLSGAREANVAGHTASLLLVCDEAQDVDEDWFDRQFRPMAASTGAATVLFGTPWQGDSLLEHAIERNRARDGRMRGEVYRHWLPRHHQVSWEEVARTIPTYGRFVELERERLGPNHPIFLSQYELVASSAEGRLLDPGQLWSLEGPFPALEAPLPGERYVGGIDFGGEGSGGDSTVLTIGRLAPGSCDIVAAFTWQGVPFDRVTSEVPAIARAWRLERLVCDATGMGAPLTSTLKRALGRLVEPFVFSQQSKSALGFELIAAAGAGELRIAPPSTPALQLVWDELRICKAERVRGGMLHWGAPSGSHDDSVASLALCLTAANTSQPQRVAVGRSRAA